MVLTMGSVRGGRGRNGRGTSARPGELPVTAKNTVIVSFFAHLILQACKIHSNYMLFNALGVAHMQKHSNCKLFYTFDIASMQHTQ